MDNIDRFNYTCAALLTHLYANFPQSLRLDVEDFRVSHELPESISMEDVQATLRFLHSEQFVLARDPVNFRVLVGLALTQKGLTALNKIPNSISGSKPWGSQLKEALCTASNAAIATAVQGAMQAAVSGSS